ncbi:hypothetical protein BP6252_04124 [Coleophoma cylindrospora]|uniref:PA14 domain-containing protein n=1 Tax=Coleophoma cylindrospora TaxID=1849047 RepID=A0A3D8RZM0_9HELO|nr:hypothetical protein BP6252_04124 [Coleophoma cylindrospora]
MLARLSLLLLGASSVLAAPQVLVPIIPILQSVECLVADQVVILLQQKPAATTFCSSLLSINTVTYVRTTTITPKVVTATLNSITTAPPKTSVKLTSVSVFTTRIATVTVRATSTVYQSVGRTTSLSCFTAATTLGAATVPQKREIDARLLPGLPNLPVALPTLPVALPNIPAVLPTLPAALPNIPAALPTLPVALPTLPAALPNIPAALPNIPAALPTGLPISLPTGLPIALPTGLPIALPTSLGLPTGLGLLTSLGLPTGLPIAIPTDLGLPTDLAVPTFLAGLTGPVLSSACSCLSLPTPRATAVVSTTLVAKTVTVVSLSTFTPIAISSLTRSLTSVRYATSYVTLTGTVTSTRTVGTTSVPTNGLVYYAYKNMISGVKPDTSAFHTSSFALTGKGNGMTGIVYNPATKACPMPDGKSFVGCNQAVIVAQAFFYAAKFGKYTFTISPKNKDYMAFYTGANALGTAWNNTNFDLLANYPYSTSRVYSFAAGQIVPFTLFWASYGGTSAALNFTITSPDGVIHDANKSSMFAPACPTRNPFIA